MTTHKFFEAFDPEIYRSLNSDLVHLSTEQIQHHYETFGQQEGRICSEIKSRDDFILLANKFTKAIELGPFGIRVNAILPGAVEGPRIRAVIASKAKALGIPEKELSTRHEKQAVLGRLVTARDVANMALFAASDAAKNITGQELVVDGHTQALI